MDDPAIEALAALLSGSVRHRRATVLWRRFIDDPPASSTEIARELGIDAGVVNLDQITALNDLIRLRQRGHDLSAIPQGTRLHAAVFGDRYAVERQITSLVQQRKARRRWGWPDGTAPEGKTRV